MRAWAAEHCPHVDDVDGATAEFVDYWRGVSGRYGVKLDWLGTWRNRLRELEGRASRKGPFAGNGARPIRLRTADEIEAEEAARGRVSAA